MDAEPAAQADPGVGVAPSKTRTDSGVMALPRVHSIHFHPFACLFIGEPPKMVGFLVVSL